MYVPISEIMYWDKNVRWFMRKCIFINTVCWYIFIYYIYYKWNLHLYLVNQFWNLWIWLEIGDHRVSSNLKVSLENKNQQLKTFRK